MNNFIKNLQERPETTKKFILWSGVSIIMAAILAFWVITFLSQIPPSEEGADAQNIKKELPGIWEELKNQFNNLKALENLWQK